MPVIVPGVSTVNLTPTSVLEGSESAGVPGVTELFQTLHGQARGATVTLADAGVPTFPLSSVARAWIVAVPAAPGVQVYVQLPRPDAGCQVVPPSVDTSTPPTTPPTSLAVPEMPMALPACTVPPPAGEVITTVGAVVSVDPEAAVRPEIRVTGWTPMSARRFTVACCIGT